MRFLLTILAIWGSMHLYVFLRVWRATGLPWRHAALPGFLALLLMLAPVAGTVLHTRGHLLTGRIIARAGMVWTGAFFLFFCISVLHDLSAVLVRLAAIIFPAWAHVRLVGPRSILVEAALVVLICVYGAFEARHIVTEHVTIQTRKFPESLPRVRIVQIGDVHLGISTGRGRLKRILSAVRAAEPDVLVSTGDLVDSVTPGMDELADMLAAAEAPLGKYAIYGNHEYYGGLDRTRAFTRRAGFTMLANEAVGVCEGLSIVGFEDDTAVRVRGRARWDETDILRRAHDEDYVVVLKHRPVVEPRSVPLMDIQLSGHTHRGQIFPFTLAIVASYEHPHGLVELAPGTYLYTTRGAGTWGPPIRFLNPPEVTVIDIVRSET